MTYEVQVRRYLALRHAQHRLAARALNTEEYALVFRTGTSERACGLLLAAGLESRAARVGRLVGRQLLRMPTEMAERAIA
jgi:hypothetical protein